MATAQDFFKHSLPGLVVSRFDDFLGTSGTISFKIRGSSGGDWTLHFADPDPIREGFDEAADLALIFEESAFSGFVAGTLDAADAVSTGQVKAWGNFELLDALAALMMPLQRDNLGWDAG